MCFEKHQRVQSALQTVIHEQTQTLGLWILVVCEPLPII